MLLYSWGANTYGQLGLGRQCEEVRSPYSVELQGEEENILKRITTIEVGGNQSFLLIDDGSIYGCGLNNMGQLGYTNLQENKFVRLSSLEKYQIQQLSCKWDTCYAITKDNVCIGWGGNSFGQLGLPPMQLGYSKEPIVLSKTAKQVAAGLRHSAILLTNGKVITSGFGKRGQLGRQFVKDSYSFDLVSDLDNVITVACGQNFSLALTGDKTLYGWGCNKFGQIGLNPEQCQFSDKPVSIDIPSGIFTEYLFSEKIVLKCGWTHCFLHIGTKLISWGRNNYGQLGISNKDLPYSFKIVNVLLDENIKEVAVGAEHNLISTEGGILKTWGWNEHGSCGDGSINLFLFQPCLIKMSSRVKMLGAGSGHSFCLLE